MVGDNEMIYKLILKLLMLKFIFHFIFYRPYLNDRQQKEDGRMLLYHHFNQILQTMIDQNVLLQQ